MKLRSPSQRQRRLFAQNVCRFALSAAAVLLAGGVPVSTAALGQSDSPLPTITPAPIQDDANLHDVQFLDGPIGWAVGDHGVIWRTDDDGRTWQLLPCLADCALRSVCFVNERVGWIVGGATMPFTRLGVGIVMGTVDGGRTWTELGHGRLPQLQSVRFFSPDKGVLVGEANAQFPTGIITTADGGKTWHALEGGRRSGWRAADFLSPEVGVTAGIDGTTARIDGKLLDVRAAGFAPRGLFGVKLGGGDSGWIVGDGALVLRTENRGVVWQSTVTPLPEQAADIFNFRAVAVRGDKVWIAGAPGSVVWHSPDGGQTWQPQRTGQFAPLERLCFQSDETGWAVGALGSILRTDDGGKSWRPLRGGDRRAALIAIQPRAGRISYALLAKEAAERGYRSIVTLPLRGDEEGTSAPPREFDLRLQDAVMAAGGSHLSIGWRLPLDVPGLDRDADKLIADWMLRTEGRFREIFCGNLVCEIRTWRPSVVVIDEPAPDDAAAHVLADAVLEAVREAADPTCFPAHRDLAALGPWKTSRVFARMPPGSAGDFVVQAHETLSRLHSTVETVAASAASRVTPVNADLPETEAYRLVMPSREAGDGNANDLAPADFFAGLSLGPDARRQLPPLDTEVDEKALRLAQRDRNFRALLKQRTRSASHGAELLAMLRSATRGADRTTASLQLATLADAYRRNGQWELAEATSVELVEQYPNEAATFEAMCWLLQYWTTSELTYQRFRGGAARKERLEFNPAPVEETIQKALAVAQSDPKSREPIDSVVGPDPGRLVSHPGSLRVDATQDWASLELKAQRQRAVRMAQLIRRTSPTLFRSSEVQLPLASLLRQCGLPALPEEQLVRPTAGRKKEAAGETAFPFVEGPTQKTANCVAAKERPTLDALLSDTCWQQAVEIPLTTASHPLPGDAPHAFVLLAHDAQYLYFAISVPRVAGMRKDGVVGRGRKHDQDLSSFDRVALCFDVDRDFVSWYSIEIDQRGCVAESCWGDPAWNPQMSVAAQADDDHWRIEGAIPFSELVPTPPKAGEQWGLAVLRTIPAVRLESWAHPAAPRPRPETFGVLRFQ